jgi:hypothetical protein
MPFAGLTPPPVGLSFRPAAEANRRRGAQYQDDCERITMTIDYCVNCVPVLSRITEQFDDCAQMAQRMAALAAMSTLAFACADSNGKGQICYKGFATRYGVLPRYEGTLMSTP